jgi:hypothetical protein
MNYTSTFLRMAITVWDSKISRSHSAPQRSFQVSMVSKEGPKRCRAGVIQTMRPSFSSLPAKRSAYRRILSMALGSHIATRGKMRVARLECCVH